MLRRARRLLPALVAATALLGAALVPGAPARADSAVAAPATHGITVTAPAGAVVDAAAAASSTSARLAAAGSAGYRDGVLAESRIGNCITSQPEYGIGTYVGAYQDTRGTQPLPYPGQSFFIRVVMQGIGNACSGQRAVPAFVLPSGLALDTTGVIECYVGATPTRTTSASDCPQAIAPNVYGANSFQYPSADTAHARLWPLPQGGRWEFRFPVKAATAIANAPLQGYVLVADGWDNPTLAPSVPLLVYAFQKITPSVKLTAAPFAKGTHPKVTIAVANARGKEVTGNVDLYVGSTKVRRVYIHTKTSMTFTLPSTYRTSIRVKGIYRGSATFNAVSTAAITVVAR